MQKQISCKPLPFFFVGKDITKTRKHNYLNQKHGLLSEALGKPDTISIWYSKEHITKLLEEIEHANGDGLRIYLGMYEPSHQFAGQLCLVMNATREKIAGECVEHVNVVLENEPDFEDRSAQARNGVIFQGENVLFSIIKDFNFGSPCPPRCDDPGDDDDGGNGDDGGYSADSAGRPRRFV